LVEERPIEKLHSLSRRWTQKAAFKKVFGEGCRQVQNVQDLQCLQGGTLQLQKERWQFFPFKTLLQELCRTSDRSKRLDRDLNAAFNILLAGTSKERPAYLSRMKRPMTGAADMSEYKPIKRPCRANRALVNARGTLSDPMSA